VKTLIIARWAALFGGAIGALSIFGLTGLLSLVLLVAAWCVIAEWRVQRAAETSALRAHESIAAKVESIIRGRDGEDA